MSVDVSAWVWRNGPRNGTDRIVLLAIADRANDDGFAYPSMADISERCCMTERGARKVIRRLESDGWIKTSVGGGRGGRSNYTVLMSENPEPECINPEPETRNTDANPEPETRNAVPGKRKNPEPECINPEPECTKPGTTVPPNHQGTVKEPSNISDAREIRETLMKYASPNAADSFIKYRRKSKSPLTVTAANRIANTLHDILSRGGNPDDALGLAEERGWRGLQADWYFKSMPAPDRRENRTDAALEQIARIAGLSQAQGNGGD